MSIKYNIHQDPPRKDGKPAARHLRTIYLTPIDIDELVHEMHKTDGIFSAGTNIGVLYLLARTMGELLGKGAAVQIKTLGTFLPRIEGDVEDIESRGTKHPRVKNLRVGSVEFRPDAEFLEAINHYARFEHVPETLKRTISDDELTAFLAAHFATHSRLLRHDLEGHFHISKRRALDLLNRLLADRRLLRKGRPGRQWYELP